MPTTATEAPVNSWFDIPNVMFSAAQAFYAVQDGEDWTAAHIVVVEVGTEKYGLLVCDVLDNGRVASPITAQVGVVLDENVVMTQIQPQELTVELRVEHAPSLVTLIPLGGEHLNLKLRFEERSDYLACIKVMNDAEIMTEGQRDDMTFALRRGLATAIPRDGSPPAE
ncbi:hypothetical protein C8Q76DRAFT_803965 [Earliella scabrosa]|nr:hypothetical protein C8Q76DRAFT_803965 [Earliella scabrosa]